MKFATNILSALLCAEAALALVPASRSEARHLARRQSRGRRTAPFRNATVTEFSPDATVQSNWGGAILESTGFTEVSATANAPKGSGASTAAGSAWVGIDGATCQTAILQTGFDWYGDGTYDAWYEWYPNNAADFTGFTISEGDDIKMSVTATSKTSGSATMENMTTGKKVTQTFTDETAGSLCLTDAEFIIEDFEECDSSGSNCEPVAFAAFSPAVAFSDCSATANGESVALSSGTITEVEVDSKDLTKCSTSGTTLTCSYV
ncbi:Scytalidopepsin B [Lachnellula occidentalis]|uniref:Scytalidopepsin B n=1 Tax=Lachnellula occidentalis TaxID=215460 RepID=A0A8H8RS13_9HELO|nr:Scytalidopepsin B [Lachnellula occidentalis]